MRRYHLQQRPKTVFNQVLVLSYLQFQTYNRSINVGNGHVAAVLNQKGSHFIQHFFDIFPRQLQGTLQRFRCNCSCRRSRIFGRIVKGRNNGIRGGPQNGRDGLRARRRPRGNDKGVGRDGQESQQCRKLLVFHHCCCSCCYSCFCSCSCAFVMTRQQVLAAFWSNKEVREEAL